MEISIEFRVNKALRNAFIAHLENTANGLGGEDKIILNKLKEEAESTTPEEWRGELRSELGIFILFQAGFQCMNGYEGDDWEANEQ